MKAKDSVLKEEEIKKLYMGYAYHPSFEILVEIRHGINEIVEAQAEISFKAGIREVIEWIEEGGYLMGDVWQAKLKEWGV